MSLPDQNKVAGPSRAEAQRLADRIRMLRQDLASEELQSVLALTPDQQSRLDEWSRTNLAALARHFDVDTSVAQGRVSWGMRIASTLGGLALCAAVVLFYMRYSGYLETWAQLTIVISTPLVLLAAAEFAARRERAGYFTGLLALVAQVSFIMNLVVVGNIFNITSTERALLAWGAFAMVLAYRYRQRLMLAFGLVLLMSYANGAYNARMGYQWLDFYSRPEHYCLLGPLVFAVPLYRRHANNTDFAAVYRLVGALTFFIAILSLADLSGQSYLPWETVNIERLYEITGLILSAGAIWWGIVRNWNNVVNTGAAFFTIFLFTRLYHWWWDWMPKYLFFAAIGILGIALVLGFKRLRGKLTQVVSEVPA